MTTPIDSLFSMFIRLKESNAELMTQAALVLKEAAEMKTELDEAMECFRAQMNEKKLSADILKQLSQLEHSHDVSRQVISEQSKLAKHEPRNRPDVKGILLHMLAEAEFSGLSVNEAINIAEEKNILLERPTVATLLSRMKREGRVTFENNKYRLKAYSGYVAIPAEYELEVA